MAIGIAIGIGFRQLIATIATLVNAFKTRVLADGGTFEGEANLLNQKLADINAASFVYVPSSWKTSKLYALKPTDGSGDLAFTRNSSANRFNSSGVIELMGNNVPTISYVNGIPTLLLDPARTNLFLNSLAPATQNITVVNGSVYTVSINGGTATLSGAGSGSATTGSNRTFTASGTTLTVTISGSPSWCQVELGSFATTIITTTSSSVTRVSGNCSKTGIASQIGQTEGTWYFEFRTGNQLPTTGDGVALNPNTSNNLLLGIISGTIRIYIYHSSGFILLTNVSLSTNTLYKCAVRYKSGDSIAYINGTGYANSTTFAFNQPLDSINFLDGAILGSRAILNYGTIMFYKSTLSNTELQTLTT